MKEREKKNNQYITKQISFEKFNNKPNQRRELASQSGGPASSRSSASHSSGDTDAPVGYDKRTRNGVWGLRRRESGRRGIPGPRLAFLSRVLYRRDF